MWRRPNVACARAVLFVLLTSLAPGILAASGRNATPQRDVTRVPSYVAVWEASKDAVDVEWVRARVAEAAKSGEDRDRALSAVEEKLGLTCEDLAQWEPAELRRFRQSDDLGTAAHAGLRVHLEVLQRAVNMEAPRILEERSPSDHPDTCREAIRAVEYLGARTRHRGFLPLLKAVSANPQEHPAVRGTAFANIAYMPHDDVVPYYVEHVYDAEREERDPEGSKLVTRCAESSLRRLTDASFYPQGSPRERQEQWRTWWKEHKATWKYPQGGEIFLRWQ